ncbi:MAG: ParB N-terminal domain-containing protein [Bosea sp.]|uniref:ParB/RepB/Spo0J family partition protein n=1 Tax=Bosea sp. (in: a-proteobacteria) TaxID=1871050 RepID=UPI001AC1126E|nr:ParB N-terminal domain-containing protein [Bosea sp. (in: a-proteobacteria)]MBN9471706.1 ParB N-terminal domain-containing protein [Bosea sp. (in: a-proteobacteria)]
MRDVLSLSSAPALPEHEIEVEIEAIDVVNRLRLVDRAYVEMIAASISETYLHQPIAVATTPGASNRYVLVDGENRLEAYKLLGRATIPARIRELTREEREKHEIHANLIRNELTALDRTVFVGRLADIFAAENAGAQNGGDRKSKKWRQKNQFANLANWSSFSKDAARRTGLSTRSIDRTRELFGKLSPDAVALIRGTKVADNQVQLQALAEMEPERQVAVAKAIAEGAGNIAKARIVAGFVPEGGVVREAEQLLAKLEALLGRQWSLDQLRAANAMIEAKIVAAEAAQKPARATKGKTA